MSEKKRSLLDSLIDTLASTAATELTEKLGVGMSEKGKATARRHLRKQLRDSMRTGAKAVGSAAAGAAKKVKQATARKPPLAQSLTSMQFGIACGVLGIKGEYGKPVDLEAARAAKRERAKATHPDAADGKREQFEAAMKAFEWLEKYNEEVSKR